MSETPKPTTSTSSSVSNSNHQFICVDYPGLVENESEAIRTLGGMNRIEQTFQRRNRKLFLNFNPDNIFSKMLCSAQIETPSNAKTNQNDDLSNPESSNLNDSDAQFVPKSSTSASTATNVNELISMPCLLMSIKKSTLYLHLGFLLQFQGIPTCSL